MEEEESLPSMDLTRRINTFCREQKEKRRKREGISSAVPKCFRTEKRVNSPYNLERKKEKTVYSQLAHDMEKTRDVVQRSMSRASTISAEEQQMALTEKEFSMIKKEDG